MPLLATALDLTYLSNQTGTSIDTAAEVFFGIGQRLGLDWLAEQSRKIIIQTPWQREAVNRTLDDVASSIVA